MNFLLRSGSTGDAVDDLQRRLVAAGYAIDLAAEPATFGPTTDAAVRAFQRDRMLSCDGICGPDTWQALVERGYRFGDRQLYLRRPMLRGDDVAELQTRLNALGFDAGRDDGIFGPQTEQAVREFQRNAGLTVDGLCGLATRRELERLGSFGVGYVTSVRESAELRHGPLSAPSIALSIAPELAPLASPLQRALLTVTRTVLLDTAGQDDRTLAALANRMQAGMFLAVKIGDDDEARVHYFGSAGTESAHGHHLADAIAEGLASVLGPASATVGPRRTILLRETAMPAVVCLLARSGNAAAMRRVLQAAPTLSQAIAEGLQKCWSL